MHRWSVPNPEEHSWHTALDINGMEHVRTQHVCTNGVLTTTQLASLVGLNEEVVKPALESARRLALIQKVAGGWKAVG